MKKNIIYASLINDLFQFNNKWLYNILKDGVYEKRNLEDKEVIRYNLNKNSIEEIMIFSDSFINTKYNLRDFMNLGYNITPIQNISMLDQIYEPAFDFQEQEKSLINIYKMVGKVDVCYSECFISDLVSYDEHIKQMKFIKIFIGKFIKKMYIDFNVSNYLKTRKTYNGREFTEEEQEKFIKEVGKILGVEVIRKKSILELKENEYDFGEYDFCFSNNTTSEGFKTFKNRKLVQKLHISSSRSLILGPRVGEKIIDKEI